MAKRTQYDQAQISKTEDPYRNSGLGKRRALEIVRQRLELDRASFLPHWRELAEFVLPRRPRFFITDVNRGDRRTTKIMDTTATLAHRVFVAGMVSGTCNPYRNWFEMGSLDPDLEENSGPARAWLEAITNRMRTILLLTNFYQVAPQAIGDVGNFGTAGVWMEEDFDSVARFASLPLGSFSISVDQRGLANTIVREFRMTVQQVVEKFALDSSTGEIDWSNISLHLQSLYNRDLVNEWVDIIHCVRPNPDWNPKRLESKFKRFQSTYYEKGISGTTSANYFTDDPTKFLEEKGYDFFPPLIPRWEVCGEDYYGTMCPGMIALPDIKQLQTGEKRSLQAIEKMVNPPMKGPASLATKRPSILPGDMTYVDEQAGHDSFKPVHEVRFDVDKLEMKQEKVRHRIDAAYFKDIMLMISNSNDPQKTATEITERKEEKFLVLGPALDQFNHDLFDPMFKTLFMFMQRQGLVPPPPPELQGHVIRPRYVSIMAQAQKLAGIGSLERFSQFITATAQAVPEANLHDNVNWDKLAADYGDRTSVGTVLRDPEEVVAIRDQRQKAQQAAAQAQMAEQAASAAKNLSQTDMGGDNALTRILDSNQTGNSPQSLSSAPPG
jgi:hypothetical protein